MHRQSEQRHGRDRLASSQDVVAKRHETHTLPGAASNKISIMPIARTFSTILILSPASQQGENRNDSCVERELARFIWAERSR